MDDYIIMIDKINQKFEQFKLLVLQEAKEVEKLESFHLTPQQEIIMFYIIRNEPVIAKDIANHLDISKSAVSQVISKLEEMRLIYRRENSKNRRETLIYLGERGKEFQKVLKRIDHILVEKYYSKVTLTDLKNVLATLNKIVGTTKNKGS
ncbi:MULTISPECIES: MarR family transcriptional regulator [Clostridia]|uniref:MarR family winged helix-turn-helix transcriptional regulator n=1 Tax=Clostridia TaxID=186801 RepID=UPI000EA059BA|nr:MULTISPECIES: MarR family transcriptional regulator [Clostridia]NBJ69952.1 MarR family transcriptional regulator [Roseburia sp. 1XD42-34]RKI77523.1 MarR family transcriptional regulator [Clostridium sp. 1xD42-85]